MVNWYISDTHFGDEAIMQFFERPFRNVQQMDDVMLGRINESVSPDDDLWIVGDFAIANTVAEIETAYEHFSKLPGRTHLIRGNHDPEPVGDFGWASVHDLVEIQDGPERFVLCHYPLLTWNNVRMGAMHLFGHVHQNWAGSRNSVNVGVDLWGFRPISAEMIAARAEELPENELWWRAERPLG